MSLRNAGVAKGMLGASALIGIAVLGVALIGYDLSPGIVLAILAVGIVIPFLVSRPDLGVHLLIAMIYVENIVYTGEGTGAQLAGGIILAGWLLSIAVNRRIALDRTPVIWLMLALVGWMVVTTMYAFNASLALQQVLSFAQLGVFMCMFGAVVDTPEKVRGIYRAIVLWTTLAAAHGLMLYYLGMRETSAGVVLNRNLMATYLDIAIICAYILYQLNPAPGERLALLVALPTLFLGLALTFSRTGYITLVVVFALVSYRLARTRSYLVLAASAMMLILMSAFLPEKFYKRVESIAPSVRHQEETFGLRVELWKTGLRMIRDHPIVGVGPGNFINALPRYGQGVIVNKKRLVSHNTYVGMAAEAGIPALVLYLLLCGAALREAKLAARGLRSGFEVIGLQAVAVELSVVVLLIAGLAGNSERLKFLYVFFGLAMSLSRISRQRIVARTARARPAGAERPVATTLDPAVVT